MKILFAAAEVTPFSKVGGLADVAGSLPRELVTAGFSIQIISPLYREVDAGGYGIQSTGISGSVRLGYTSHPYELTKCTSQSDPHLECLFVDNSFFFDREGVYTDSTGEGYLDNNARFIFFQKVVVDLIGRGILKPDLVHINDHHTALIPFLLGSQNIDLPSLMTIHNFEYQGHFSVSELELFNRENQEALQNEYPPEANSFNAMEIGLKTVNQVNTVSPSYARELLSDDKLAHGLRPVLTNLRRPLHGILNGADYSYWNPEQDQFITTNYGPETIGLKIENKRALLERCDLPFDDATPVIGMVSRLVQTKGFDLIIDILDQLMKLPVQLVVLGTGFIEFQNSLSEWAEKYPNRIFYSAAFDETLAHQIEAGADMFLMPSRFEPCGLNQIYSLKYGTPPIVHKTGGLADTVDDWDGKNGNGFSFSRYSSQELLKTIKRAVDVYRQSPGQWSRLVQNGMAADYSWRKSAEKYRDIYQTILIEGEEND